MRTTDGARRARGREDKAGGAAAGQRRAPTVLLVEDDALIRFFTAEELRAHRWHVIEAGNAEKALSLLRSGAKVDLLLTDVRMPGEMDGAALAHRVRQDYPEMKVVVVTAHLRESELAVEVHGFFRKPVDMPRLARHVRALLDPACGHLSVFGPVASSAR